MIDPDLLEKLIRQAYASIDGFEVKNRVDSKGIDNFISSCAELSASTGFVAGAAGPLTLAPLLVLDVGNYFYQQVRITMGVIYHRTGRYAVGFEEMLTIMAVALGVRIGAVAALFAGRSLIVNIGQDELVKLVLKQLAKRIPPSAVSKSVPLLGGVLGAAFNLVSIRAYGRSLLKVDQALFGTAGPHRSTP